MNSYGEPATNKRFLHLPALWMTRAADMKFNPARYADWALYAVALELLLVASLRRCEIIALNIKEDLHRQRPGNIEYPSKIIGERAFWMRSG
jgi:hypothetical protein